MTQSDGRALRSAVPGGLEIHALTAGYGPTPVLPELDLRVAEGTLACLVGPSGSGKSTLLRCVAGLHPLRSGTITLAGRRLDGLPPERRGIGLVPQDAALFTHLDVDRNIGYGLFRSPRAERRARVAELLELTGLAGLGRRMPHQLSGGQQQRVALARALAPRPSLVLLDEPFSGLDPHLRGELREQLRGILAELGTTAVLVSHDRDEAMSLGQQVVVMRDGRIRQAGTPWELYRRPADPWTGQFVGDAIVLTGISDGSVVRCALGSIGHEPSPTGLTGPVTVLLRPEQVRLSLPARIDPATPAVETAPTPVRVDSASYRGRDWRVTATTEGGETLVAWWSDDPAAHSAAASAPAPGDRLLAHVRGPAVVFPAAEKQICSGPSASLDL